METLVVVPTWNERKNIQMLIPRLAELLPESHFLVVDDNSPDGTAEEVRNLQKTFPQVHITVRDKKEGLGKAYIHGFREAFKFPELKKIVMMDADFSHDPAYVPEMLAKAKEADVVIGSRYIIGGSVKGWDRWRVMLSKGGNMYCRALLRMPVSDYTGGFYVIDRKRLEDIDFGTFDSSGYAFQIELKYALWKKGATFKEIPISFKNRREGESKISNHIIFEGLLAPWKILLKG